MSFATEGTGKTARRAHRAGGRRMPVRLGFVPLIDSAPLIAAAELGYFADESLDVSLQKQIGWGNVRDKLTFGQLDASHALVGMPVASLLGRERFSEPLVSLMTLATGGNGITLSKSLVDRGVTSATGLCEWVKSRQGERRVRLAHVFGCSAHHYLLRMWLETGGIDPDRDVDLCVVPPPQMGWQLEEGCIDGFCAGEPWNTLAQSGRSGVVVAATADLVPSHPEKVLAVTRRWLSAHADLAERLVRATLRGGAYCHEPANRAALAGVMARKQYLGLPANVLEAALSFSGPTGNLATREVVRRSTCFDPAGAFPSATHMAWVLDRMVRAGDAPAQTDPLALARRSCDAGVYRRAAGSLELATPSSDFPPMPLRAGTYDPLARRRDAQATGA